MERCELTDLLLDQCAHCLGHTLDEPEENEMQVFINHINSKWRN